MTFTSFMIGVGLVFIVFLLFVLFMTPVTITPEMKEKKKLQKKRELEDLSRKDWEAVAKRYQEQMVTLHEKIDTIEKKEQETQKLVIAEQEKRKIVEEKADRERGWFEREKAMLDKKSKEIEIIKENLKSAQEELNQKHLLQVRIERELKESKREADGVSGEKHRLEMQVMELKAVQQNLEGAVAEVKRQNKELTKKDSDLNWISVGDYDKLKKVYHESERELRETKEQIKLLKEELKNQASQAAAPAPAPITQTASPEASQSEGEQKSG